MVQATREFTLFITEQERQLLLNFLDQSLGETHAEARRTESPDYQEIVHQEEALLRGLIAKLRRAV